jgi:D-alanyl-D-alanine dipeptidase
MERAQTLSVAVTAILVGAVASAPRAAPADAGAPPPASAPAEPAARAEDPSLEHGFVDLADVAPGVRIDVRYAGADNFVGRPVRGYGAARCLVTRRAAAAISRVERALEARGYRLVVYDCYRPMRAVGDLVAWARRPPAGQRTPAHNPDVPKGELVRRGYIASRSAHARGSTVDLTLAALPPAPAGAAHAPAPALDCRTVMGELAPDGTMNMGTTYDCFDEQAHGDAVVPPDVRKNRELLRAAMEKEGFVAYDKEWWHFSLASEPYPDKAFDFEIVPRR